MEQGTFSDVSQTEAYKHLQYKSEEKQSPSTYYVGAEKIPLAPWANSVGEEEYLQVSNKYLYAISRQFSICWGFFKN